ncbi:ATP-binding protein [Xanthomarina sp. GH4-25]|uniref:ATP-binding protein n=1 Tax=Xanthomarina sp. GH4-25 TaxID=3349335 RepID=UPI003877C64F
MKLTKKIETEIWKIYDTWMQGYLNADVETYNYYFDEDYHFIGSTNNEEFLNKKDTTDFFKATGDQFAGLTDLRKETKTIEVFGEHVFITHFFDAWFKNEKDWSYYGRFRFSSVMHKTKEGWRFIYQHFSMPDSKSEEGQTIGFDKVHLENQELREAIQRRTTELEQKNRELEVETALERIRAQAVAMKESTDLLDIVVTMRNEFIKLGHEAHYFWHMMWLPKTYEKAMTSGDGSKIGFVMELPRHIHGDIPQLAKWEKSKKPTVVYVMNVDEAIEYVDKMINLGDFKNIDPQAPTHDDIRHIGGLTFIMARTTHGEIGYSLPGIVKNPPKEDIDILVKFAGAFDLAHQRFLDLQKAEKQARETQIELSLERVRSIAMGMSKPNDLMNICKAVFTELQSLGFNELRNTMIHSFPEDDSYFINYDYSDKTGKNINQMSAKGDLMLEKFTKEIRNSDGAFQHLSIEGKELVKWKAFRKADNQFEDKRLDAIDALHYYNYSVSNSGIGISTYSKISDEKIELLQRFRNVFQLAYKRFTDISTAEKQAREVQIELALEKVRSRTMAMQRSEELQEASFLLDQQIRALGIKTWGCAFNIYGENESTEWFGNEAGILHTYTVPREGIFKDYYNKGQKGESLVIKEFSGDDCVAHYEYMSSLPVIGDVLKTLKKTNNGFPTYQIDHVVYFRYGYLLFITREHVPDSHDIFKRFAKVFEQTYTRFLDLQKAEAQAREAQIETALERVRSSAMAMHKSDDLTKAVDIVFSELKQLEFNTVRCGIGIFNDQSNNVNVWTTSSNNKKETSHLSGDEKLEGHPLLDGIYNAWKKQVDFSYTLKNKDLENYYQIVSNSNLPVTATFDDDKLTTQYYHVVVFPAGGLFAFSDTEFTQDKKLLMKRFGEVFHLSFTRHLDLKQAEAQAREARIEMALEKVRSRTMAMQNSSELPEAANNLFLQVQELGIPAWSAGYCIWEDNQKSAWCNMSSEGEIQKGFSLPTIGEGYNFEKPLKNNEPFHVAELGGKKLVKHYDFMKTLPGIGEVLEDFDKKGIDLPTFQIFHIIYYTHGYLMFITYEPVPNDWEVFKRFGKVFEQTYTRFLDLQKAEAQTREAQIEAALERTRTQSMLMQHSNELNTTAQVFHEQLQLLGIDSEFSYLWLPDETEKNHQFWATWSERKKRKTIYKNKAVTFPLDKSEPSIEACYVAWESGETVHVNPVQPDQVEDYFNTWSELLNGVEKFKPELFPVGLYYIDAYMDYGCFGIMIKRQLNNDEKNILSRFSKEFQRTYTRFLDLQKAEAQTRTAQINLAVERVRAKALAMHKSEEIMQVVAKLKDEVMSLDIPDVIAATIFLNEGEDKVRMWDLSSLEKDDAGYEIPFDITFKLKKSDPHLYVKRVWENPNDYFLELQEAKDFKRIIAWLRENNKNDIADEVEEYTESTKLERLHHAVKKLNNGKLVIDLLNPPSNEMETILTKMGAAFDLAYKRFEDLQKAEAQAREAQIEAALERVRSRSLAMQKSDELLDVIGIVSEQANTLGLKFDSISFGKSSKEGVFNFWMTSKGQPKPILMDVPYIKNNVPQRVIKAQKQGLKFLADVVTGNSYKKWNNHILTNTPIQFFPEVIKNYLTEAPGFARSSFFLKEITLYVMNYQAEPFSDTDNAIFNRFAQVFDQSYTRFLDLQKAEAQAREAQIEASLERVRSRTMAMHNSNELGEVAAVLFEQVSLLTDTPNRFNIGIINETKKTFNIWITDQEGKNINNLFVAEVNKSPIVKKNFEAWKADKKRIIQILEGKQLENWIAYMGGEVGVPFDKKRISKQRYINSIFFKQGFMGITTSEPIEENTLILLERFTAVFQQAYTRFLDLQKAEAQSRESQIEAALEKVRSRSLAMHKTDELQEVVAVVAEKLHELGVIFDAGGVILCTYFPDNKDVVHWIAVDDFSTSGRYFVPYFDNPIFNEAWDSKSRGDAYFSKEFTVEAKNNFFKQAFEHSDYRQMPDDYKRFVLQADKHYLSAAWSKNSAIIIPSLTGAVPSESDAEIIKRFAKVFEQAYIRFMDLQKAEAQARESLIEIGLERVRSRTLAMQTSEELAETAVVLFKQLIDLGVAPNRLFIGIIKDEGSAIEAWATNEDGSKIASQFTLQASKNKSINKMLNGWKQDEKSLVIDMKGKELQDYFQYLNKEMNIPFMYGLEQKRRVQTLAYFSGGLIGMAAPNEQSEDSMRLLERFASVFNLTYTRFNDLKIAEAQAKKAEEDLINLQLAKKSAENALSELQLTQTQLIQSEKMASLGELTAGIAHEIQNPLNFVNNFSEVSKELLDEMLEEIENGDMEEVKAIMNDVIQNLEKINHHGKRADGIVKGMLQHSRASGDKKELTDINALADEYLRLAYHGLRAKDKSFNASLITDFDDKIGTVSVIPQDIGRVILNLLTNAFYIVNEKKQSNQNGYEPTVSLVTKKEVNGVTISVKDNGNGIPKKVLNKIFQPFFTTKPTGQGTGLGLSMSYDIITKGHGGELLVETKDGEGTTFSIQLPIKSNL